MAEAGLVGAGTILGLHVILLRSCAKRRAIRVFGVKAASLIRQHSRDRGRGDGMETYTALLREVKALYSAHSS